MKSLGKKISCPKCHTKLFTFNKDTFKCPVCNKNINIIKKETIDEENMTEEQLDKLSEDELINKVIPPHYYMEIEDILNNLDEKN
jgi:uncharacterized Zn finger protein (UPF0148 family)